jgi:uncharacterized protein (TIGR02246 family)
LIAILTLTLLAGTLGASGKKEAAARAEIEAFNREFTAAHLRMDNAAILGMWADEGVSLLPGMAPMTGKPAITEFMERITAQMPGYKVTRQEDEFHDIRVSGDWASEWATTYQVVQPPDGKPAIETHGKMLLVLHRASHGQWRIECEMWNPGARKN